MKIWVKIGVFKRSRFLAYTAEEMRPSKREDNEKGPDWVKKMGLVL